VLLAMAVWVCAAEGAASPSGVQPSVLLPDTEILKPDAAAGGLTGGKAPAAVPETSHEIRRPAEAAGGRGDGKREPAMSQGTAGQDARVVSRQGAARGLWRMSDFLPLAVVLLLVLGAAWLVKRYLPARRLVTGSGVLEIVARLPLAPRQSLVLVKMGRRMILVGVSPERVNTVCLVDDPDQVAELIGRMASETRESASRAFDQSLDQQADEFEDEAAGEPPLQGAGGVRGLLEKVRRLSRSGVAHVH